ncbi:MAG TPA: M56 family metallopeptidase [Gemmatimonadaceae bacterium]|nr:M56 family metallopeptidase [Gemmatimonadaceae bacterium]
MIAAWMLHAAMVAAITALAALLTEHGVRALRRPVRFIWVGALFVALSLTLGRLLLGTRAEPTTAPPGVREPAIAGQPTGGGGDGRAVSTTGFASVRARFDVVSVPGWLSVLDEPLLIAWALGSGTWAVLLVSSAVRVRTQSGAWRATSVDGVPVHVSDDTGPALLGITRHRIVLPSWVLDLEPGQRRMVLLHEREHARAADPSWLLVGALFVLLQPWNPVVWLMHRRLRLAVEADCDARVLAQATDVRSYGELLLDVGARSPGGLAPVAALSEAHSILERRISLMTQLPSARPRLRSAAALAVAALLGFVACQLPRPAAPVPAAADSQQGAAAGASSTSGGVTGKRTIVTLTSLGLEGTGSSTTILVFADGPARIGIGDATLAALTDTLRLANLPSMAVDVTDSDVHLRLVGAGRMRIGAEVTNGAASKFSATGSELVVLKGGAGVRFGPAPARSPKG